MKTTAISLVGGLIAATLPAYAADSQDYDLNGFDSVDVSTGYDAEITVGEGFSVRAETKGGDLDWLKLYVKGDTLYITRKQNISWNWSGPKTTVYVTMPSLVSLEVSSGADAIAEGVDAENFSVDVSSGADAKVSGKCGDVSADASSGADIEAKGLVCKTGDADVSSGADIVLTVTEEITADASSGGDIVVYGSPKVKSLDTSSGGGVKIRE